MDAKKSKWLSISSSFLQARIGAETCDKNQFIEELNLRREALTDAVDSSEKVTSESLEGVYQVVGANSENSEQGYFGMLSLSYDDNKIHATWMIEGQDVQTGFGLLTENMLSLHFVYHREDIEYKGLVTYEFLSDTMIYGNWIEEDTDEIGVELGRKLPIKKTDPLSFFGLY